MPSQYFKSSFNIALASYDFVNQIRKLLVPVLLGGGLLLSAGAKANYEFQSLSNDNNLKSAEIYFTAKKPDLGGFRYYNYTLVSTKLKIGGREYSVSDDPVSPSVVVSFADLDLVLSGAETKFVYSYDLSFFQAITEAGACWKNYLTLSAYVACMENVWIHAWKNQTQELEFTTRELVSAINALIQNYNINKNKLLKNLNIRTDFPFTDNAGQIERDQFKYILIKGTQDYFETNSSHLVDAVANEFIVGKITNKLQESDETFSEVLHAFESIDCNHRFANHFPHVNGRFPNKLTDYAAKICSYNEHVFIEHIAKISPVILGKSKDISSANAADVDFNPLVFCNKYICEFKLKPDLSYRIVVSKADHIKDIKRYVIGVVNAHITKGCRNFCDISDVDSLITLFENQSVSWAVNKITPFSFLENSQTNYSLQDGDYKISILEPLNSPNSEEILKLSNNQYKVFYWSKANKNVFYKYDPRFFDSRYILSVPSNGEISAIFNDILNIAKQKDSKIVNLSLWYEEQLDCFSTFSSCMNGQFIRGSKSNPDDATIEELNAAIKKDASVGFIIAGHLIYIPKQGDEYCRIPQKGNNDDLNMPLKKDSERDFIANMKAIDLRVVCFTVDVSDSNEVSRSMMFNHMIEKLTIIDMNIRSSISIEDRWHPDLRRKETFNYAIDCNPLDASVQVEQKITQCPQYGAKITYFLAIPKAGHLDFRDLLSGQHIKEYLEIAPWGNLKDAVVNRDRMFYNSTIESVQINSASSKMMRAMFAHSNRLKNGNFKFWNTSKVTDTSWMFYGASSFDQSIKNWNLSNLHDPLCMFDKPFEGFKDKLIVVTDAWSCRL